MGIDTFDQLAVVVDKSEPNIARNAIELGTKDDFAKLGVRFVADEKTMAPSEMIDCGSVDTLAAKGSN